MDFIRVRVSSHHLAIEIGRWSRIPKDEPLCPCGQVQTESHILLEFPLSEAIRQNSNHMDFESLHTFFQTASIVSLYVRWCQRYIQDIPSNGPVQSH